MAYVAATEDEEDRPCRRNVGRQWRKSSACVAEEDDEDCITRGGGCSDGHGDDIVV
ncbi:hypothetical protein TRIUR3_26133 [Triticum urartu]|uniref:Uncharacterized protein n=1 Tax=Triticum urartu TaxID=4572 RepID=M7ZV22_TRIUA|nr:hypothetical protein TRIUR3_26133 [Triticum urartu]